MSISEELNKIKNAIYGREVRDAIHDGIKKTYDDASQGGNANMEVSLARGNFPTLSDRLNSVDSQLADKANRSYVDAQMSSITDGSPKELFYSIDELIAKYPTGATGPMLVMDESFTDGAHVFIWNEEAWLDVGTNFTWRLGSLNTHTGKPAPHNITRIRNLEYTYLENGVIRLTDHSNYKFMVFQFSQDNDDSFISASDWLSESYNIQEPGYYRVLIAYQDDREIDEQEVDTLGSMLRIHRSGTGWVDVGVYQATGVPKKSIGLEKLDEISLSAVLPNVKIGSEMDWRLGSLRTTDGKPPYPNDNNTTRIRSLDYSHVTKGSLVSLRNYDNHKFMVFQYSSPADSTFITASPWLSEDYIIEEPCFIKILMAFSDDRDISEADKAEMPNLLKIMTNKVGEDNIADQSIKINHLSDEVRNALSKEGGYYFRGPVVPAIPVGSSALGYNEFMQETWEDLRAKHPNYIKRSAVIRDTSDTFDIYEYTFTPDNYEKTVFLTAGIHGDEYESFWGLYYFMKYIAEESHKYEQLRDLRHNVRFVIIPILNPWGVENRTRATSRVGNANNNYDIFHRAPEYEAPAGTHAFSENEALAVKLIADKYNAEFDFFADFHTDPYNPEYGNYILTNQLSSTFNAAKELTIDEISFLEERYGFVTTPRSSTLVGTNRRSSSFKYMEAVRGVPSAILEVGTGRLSPIGSSTTMTVGVDWYTNIITEMLKHDLTQPTQAKNALEKAILENRFEGYSHSVSKKIPDENIQVFLDVDGFDGNVWENKAQRGEIEIVGLNASSKTENGILFNNSKLILPEGSYDDFTLVIKGTVNQHGMILTSDGELMLQAFTRADDSGRYNIYNGDERLMCSALRYGEEVTFGVKSANGRLYLYVNGEPFNDIPAIHSTESQLFIGANNDLSESIDMSLKSLALYDRALKDDELGFVFKSFIL